MMIPATFTLHRSPVVTVRVEPPDLLIVEGPAFGALRLQRARLLAFNATSNADHIVIRLELAGMPQQILGPFARGDGIALADAIALARRDLLFATPIGSSGSTTSTATRSATR